MPRCPITDLGRCQSIRAIRRKGVVRRRSFPSVPIWTLQLALCGIRGQERQDYDRAANTPKTTAMAPRSMTTGVYPFSEWGKIPDAIWINICLRIEPIPCISANKWHKRIARRPWKARVHHGAKICQRTQRFQSIQIVESIPRTDTTSIRLVYAMAKRWIDHSDCKTNLVLLNRVPTEDWNSRALEVCMHIIQMLQWAFCSLDMSRGLVETAIRFGRKSHPNFVDGYIRSYTESKGEGRIA